MGVLAPNSVVYGENGGRYRVVRLLGEGGMSRVWLAEDLRDGKYVVIKEPITEENADVNVRGLNKEVEILHRLMSQFREWDEEYED
jgi:serine/threonine protein kinase